MKKRRSALGLLLITAVLLTGWLVGSAFPQTPPSKTIEELYPGLASDVLKLAVPAKLPTGVLLSAGEFSIKESEISRVIKGSEAGLRRQLSQNAFFLLENMATKGLILQEARKAGITQGTDKQMINDFFSKTIKVPPVTEEEIKHFYQQNKETIGSTPLDQIRGMLKEYLAQQKRQEAVRQYLLTLGQRTSIQINEVWLKKQATLALNNPVDRARRSGKPTMAEFGATGCVPCDMMAPILEDLKKKYSDKINVLFVHVGQEQILGARFGIQGIPVQVFFDKTGKEVFRHIGFFPQNELEKKMKELGFI